MTEPISAPGVQPAPTEPTPKAARRSWPAALILVLIAGGAACSIYLSAGDDIADAWRALQAWRARPPAGLAGPSPGAPVQDRPVDDNEPANWSEIALFRAGPDRPRPVLVVRRAEQPQVIHQRGVEAGLFTRELIRQAFLVAAREGFDVVVRDRAVGDPDEPGRADAVYRLGTLAQNAEGRPGDVPQGVRASIIRGSGADRRVESHQLFDLKIPSGMDFNKLIAHLDRQFIPEFTKTLAGWGLPASKAPRPSVAPDALPEGVEAGLGALTEVEQFAALRALHDDLRRRGPSTARWRALSRGYAMLGMLTDPLMGADHAAFQARGVLYAQRAVNAEPGSAQNLRALGFAGAMAWLRGEALDDLDAADKLDGGKGITPRDEAARALIRVDLGEATRLAEKAAADDLVTPFVRGVIASQVLAPTNGVLKACRVEWVGIEDRVLDRVPDCYAAIDAECEARGVSNLHRATSIGMEAFPEASARRVAALRGLPPQVAALVRPGVEAAIGKPAVPDEVELRRALDDAAKLDGNDLSWGALAQVFREIRFWQACRRLNFLAFDLSSGAAEFAVEARGMLADHPNREFAELFTGQYDRAALAETIDRLDFGDLELKNLSMFLFFKLFDEKRLGALLDRAIEQSDPGLPVSQERFNRMESPGVLRAMMTRALLEGNPASPMGRAGMVEVSWPGIPAKAADWEREQPWNTPLIVAMGFRKLNQGRFDEAEQRFEVALKRSPEAYIFTGLAKAYRERDQADKWIEAARVMLDRPDMGLDHASIADELARYLMERGKVDQAWPWAERAARSWANWAMKTASRCAEMRRDWANAEVWVARESQRYDHEWLSWLRWCLRTGQGHVEPASRFAWNRWDRQRPELTDDQAYEVAEMGLVTGRPDVCRDLAEQFVAKEPESTIGLFYLAAAFDRLRERRKRDETWDRIARGPNPTGPKSARALGLLIGWDRDQASRPLADVLAEVAPVIESIPETDRASAQNAVGVTLAMIGKRNEAIAYLKAANIREIASGWMIVRELLDAAGEPRPDFFLENAPRAEPDQNTDAEAKADR